MNNETTAFDYIGSYRVPAELARVYRMRNRAQRAEAFAKLTAEQRQQLNTVARAAASEARWGC